MTDQEVNDNTLKETATKKKKKTSDDKNKSPNNEKKNKNKETEEVEKTKKKLRNLVKAESKRITKVIVPISICMLFVVVSINFFSVFSDGIKKQGISVPSVDLKI